MIEYIRGIVVQINPACAVIETTSGVAYLVNISLVSYDALAPALGKEVKVLTHQLIRDDAHQLFGFATEDERNLFRLLLGVSGVGANTARLILSSASPADLEMIITSGDVRRLKAVKGIGGKTAERIIVDLRDKIKPTAATLTIQASARNEAAEEALAALTMLGFARQAAQKALDKVFADEPGATAEKAIKRALSMM